MPQQIIKAEHMARGMLALYPDLAGEIALSLMHDAITIGECARAQLWWDVLLRITRIKDEFRIPIH